MNTLISGMLYAWRTLRIPDRVRWLLISSLNQKFLVGAAVVVFNDRNEVLLFQHTYRTTYAWGLPTGLVKRGESIEQAIEREVAEESCLQVRVTRLLSVQTARRVPRVDVLFLGEAAGGHFQPSLEVSQAGFFSEECMPPILPSQRAMIAQARMARDHRGEQSQ